MKLTAELARIHAHLCGDGSMYKYKTSEKDRINRAVISYTNKNPKLLEEFRKDMNKLFDVKMTFKDRHRDEVIVKSIRIFNIINKMFGDLSSRKWKIPKIIKNSSKEIKLEWLKAFFEDEAYHEKRYNRLKIKSVNYEGLKDVQKILSSIKIISNLTGPNCDDSYYLTISKFDSVKEFSNFIKEPIRK